MRTNWKRIGKLSLLAVTLTGTAVALTALAGEHGKNFGRHMFQAKIDDVLDQLNATPAQRQQLSAIETKVIDDMQAKRQAQGALMKELRSQIGQDTVNLAAFDQLVQTQRQADLRTAIQQTHDALSPAQRAQFGAMKMHHRGFEGEQAQPVQ